MTSSCRAGCGACCIAPSITTPFAGMPHGKRAGERCVHLDDQNLCQLFGHPDRPWFCVELKPQASMCGASDAEARQILTRLERDTRPDAIGRVRPGWPPGRLVVRTPGSARLRAAGARLRTRLSGRARPTTVRTLVYQGLPTMPRTLLLSLLFSSSLCAQNAYCVDTNLDILYSLDLSNGAVTAIGSTLSGGIMGTPADLCWKDDTSEIWTIDLAGGEAGTIDPTTGLFTTVWNTAISGWQAMAWDHTTSQFYCHNQNGQLHRLDPLTGILTLVGTIPGALITAMDIDATGRLWALNFGGSLVELDKNTGLALPPTIPTTVINFQGMSIDPAGVWYAISTLTDSLHTIDPSTGLCTLIGPNTGTQFVKGMVIAASPAPGFATNATLGVGCGKQSTSFYENFTTAAGFDLDNTVLTMLPNGSGGYIVLNSIGAFLPVGSIATPVSLALTDDSEVTQTFTSGTFPGATSFNICSNGFVSIGSNGTSFTPDVGGLLNATNTAWRDWHDFNPAIAGSGQVKYEESAAAIVVTWDGVWDFGGATAANANTMQMQFYPTGQVTFAWGTMSHLGNGHLVGYSPGGPSADPGNTDLSALGAGGITLSTVDLLPLGLTAATRPVLGTSWNLTTGNVPATGVFGVDIFGIADPGILDLFFLGMPGCQLRSTLDVVAGPWAVLGATHNYAFAVPAAPPSLIGLELFTQSAVFQAPPVNAFGAITSNGIKGTLGNL